MNPRITPTRLAGAALIAVIGLSVCGCGKFGPLEQPAPLFGERAKEDYAAKRAAKDAQANENRATAPTAAADQPDPNADNAPRTTRDVKDPGQDNAPISKQPIEGVPDLNGPTPSMTPPGGG